MKVHDTKSLRVIAFLPRENVPRYHFMSTVDMIVPDISSPASSSALSALARALHNTATVALVRFIKRNDSRGVNPTLGCLTPHLGDASTASEPADPPFNCLFFN